MTQIKAVIMGGFAVSGSSAVFDLLAEVDGITAPSTEWRFVTDPDGLVALEALLQNAWSPYQADIALKRFLALTKKLSRKYRAPYCGIELSNDLTPAFEKITSDFVKCIRNVEYDGMWTGVNSVTQRVRHKLLRLIALLQFRKNVSIWAASGEIDFTQHTMYFLQNLLLAIDPNAEYIVVDEPFSSLHATKVCRYFGPESKCIITMRDPRDLYLNALSTTADFVPRDINKFIIWYGNLMSHFASCPQNSQVKIIQFEELVCQYDRTKDEIFDFLSIDPKKHSKQFSQLIPEESQRNVGLWKEGSCRKLVGPIEETLGAFCGNFS